MRDAANESEPPATADGSDSSLVNNYPHADCEIVCGPAGELDGIEWPGDALRRSVASTKDWWAITGFEMALPENENASRPRSGPSENSSAIYRWVR